MKINISISADVDPIEWLKLRGVAATDKRKIQMNAIRAQIKREMRAAALKTIDDILMPPLNRPVWWIK
jgi:hypothetical protein